MHEYKKVLLFIEGTILDDRAILYLKVTKHESGYVRRLGESVPVEGSVEFVKKIAEQFTVVYHGARGIDQLVMYQEWLKKHGFPEGIIITDGYAAKSLPEGILFAVNDRVQDSEDYYPKFGITYIPVNEYCARWGKVIDRITKLQEPNSK